MIINLNEYKRLESLSVYNHNYYQNKNDNTGVAILEECKDDSNERAFYLCDLVLESKVFLGCSQSIGDENIKINLGMYYT